MYKSIIGEKWHRADGSSNLASINASISSVTDQLNKATALYLQAGEALTACYGLSQNQCLAKTGGYAHSTWSPQYDNNFALAKQLKAQLADLLKIQADIMASQSATTEVVTQKAQSDTAAAAANQAIAKADLTATTATASKWLLYAGIGVGVVAVIIGSIIAYKKLKKK